MSVSLLYDNLLNCERNKSKELFKGAESAGMRLCLVDIRI